MSSESVLLIFPPNEWGRKERFLQPLGVLILGTELRDVGIKTNVLDLSAEGWSLQKLKRFLTKGNFTYLGITVNSPFRQIAYSILREAKELNPNIITLVGGSHPSFVGEKILEECDYIDIAIAGEAEQQIAEIIQNYKPGFYQLGVVEHLDKSPIPDRSFIRHIKYNSLSGFWIDDSATIIWTRGCPWGKCTFCAHNLSMEYRKHSAERIIEEIGIIQNELNYKSLNIADNCTAFNSKYVKDILKRKIKEGLDIPFFAVSRADLIDEESIKLLREANCISLELGIESASCRLLDLYNKSNQKPTQWLKMLEKKIEMLDKNHILSIGTLIVGGPLETIEEMELTTSYCKNSKIDLVIAFPFRYLVGSQLWGDAIKNGIINENQYYTFNDKKFSTTEFTTEEIFQFAKKVENQINSPFRNPSRWKRIFRKIIKQKKWQMLFNNIIALPNILYKGLLNKPFEIMPEEKHN